jgi:hypothetical protein
MVNRRNNNMNARASFPPTQVRRNTTRKNTVVAKPPLVRQLGQMNLFNPKPATRRNRKNRR